MKKFIATKIVKENVEIKETPVNHVMVIDCSGSMSYDLPKIRKQLKNKLPSLVKEQDTVSLVWFSGKGEFGRLVDRVKVQNITDFERLNTAVERWLKPVGCTGFVEPLQSVKELINEENGTYSMMFITDGYDNEWNHNQIIEATKELAPLLAVATFVEYGYYCNHNLLEEMASEIGGSVVFAENFDSYDPIFDNVISNKNISSKKIEIEVDNPMFDFVYSVSENGTSVYRVIDGKVHIPETTNEIYYFKDEDVEESYDNDTVAKILSGLSVLVLHRKGQFIKNILKDLKLNYLYNKFSNCYGKQALYDFQKLITSSDFNDQNENIIENNSAYSVLNLLNFLQSANCKIAIDKMKYNRIGKATVQEETLSEEEKNNLAESIKNASTSDEIKEIMEKSQELMNSKKKLNFVPYTKELKISNMTWNDTRPNVSMMFKINGKVELPDDKPSDLPKEFETFIYRNFTVIRDGLVNIEELPVILDEISFITLKALKVIEGDFKEGEVTFINLRKLPLINEDMVKEISAKELFENQFKLLELKAKQKVFKYFKELVNPADKSVSIVDKYSNESAAYLANIGITDNGFSPKVKTVEGKDSYVATELIVKIKGLSNIPSVNAVKKKINEKKNLNVADSMVQCWIEECENKQNSMENKEFIEWIEESLRFVNEDIKTLYGIIVKTKFAVIIGQTWFKEFETIDEGGMVISLDGENELVCSVQLKDTTVTI